MDGRELVWNLSNFFKPSIVSTVKIPPRIAIVDRSLLAHNVYKMLLKPFGFTLFFYKTLKNLKENMDAKWGCPVFLINSNTFGNHFENHLEWLKKEPALQTANKIFLCEPRQKEMQTHLKVLSKSHFLSRPFYPELLEETIRSVL